MIGHRKEIRKRSGQTNTNKSSNHNSVLEGHVFTTGRELLNSSLRPKCHAITQKCSSAVDSTATRVPFLVSHSTCPIPKGLRKSIRVKNKLYVSGDRAKYKMYRNKICTLTRISKQQYYTKFFNDNFTNMKKTWEGINSILAP